MVEQARITNPLPVPLDDPFWQKLVEEAKEARKNEPLLAHFFDENILQQDSLCSALTTILANKLATNDLSAKTLYDMILNVFVSETDIIIAAKADAVATVERDPASTRLIEPILFFKGFQSLQAYRLSHYFWTHEQKDLARFFQMRVSETFGVDIHPGAVVGKGIMIDHAHSIVIGETAVVGDNVSMLHSVTLGGTGKEDGDRHPKIGCNVLIGAGAKVLGNIKVGNCSRIAAGSVVLADIPPKKTVAGVPAKIIGKAGCSEPASEMNQLL